MTLPQWLLEILVCPERKDLRLHLVSGQSLSAINRRIEKGLVKNRKGDLVTQPLEEALLREDRRVLYPIREGLPVLLVEEGIEVEPGEV